VDTVEMEKTRARLAAAGYGPEILTIQHRNFADVDQVAPGVLFDFVLADLGVSSMQIDDPARGFTFKQDGPLDLRLDPASGVTAAERLRQLDQEELENLLVENSDEPYADRIARAICQVFRRGGTVDTTRQLYALIEGALSFLPAAERKEAVKKSCQRTFQALRIDVNSEFEVLYAFLDKLPHVLKPGGRAAILTFHSGEDRLVKNKFRRWATACTCPPEFPVCVCGGKAKAKLITRKPIEAQPGELAGNRRSRSARLRVLEKL